MPKGKSKRTSLIASITNRPTGGGNKKEGLAPSVGRGNLSIWNGMSRAYGTPEDRDKLFCINQLGSVNPRVYQTKAPSDGVRPCPDKDNPPRNLKEAIDRTGGLLAADKRNPNDNSLEANFGIEQTRERLTNQQIQDVINVVEVTNEVVSSIDFNGQFLNDKHLITLINKAKKINLKTLVLRGCERITNTGWLYLGGILSDTTIVNLDLSRCNISFQNIKQIITSNAQHLRSLNLNFVTPSLSRDNIIGIIDLLENSTIQVLGLESKGLSLIPFMKSKHTLPKTKKLINPNAKPLLPGILELTMNKSDNDTIKVDATIQGTDKAKTGVRFNWFTKKNINNKGPTWLEIKSDSIDNSSNKFNYKTPSRVTGSRGLRENSELKCEVTPFLKQGNSIKEGKPETIEFRNNNWSIVKRSFNLTAALQTNNDEDDEDYEDIYENEDNVPNQVTRTYDADFRSSLIKLMTKTKVEVGYLNADGANFDDDFVSQLIDDVKDIQTETKVNMKALYINSQVKFSTQVANKIKGPIFRQFINEGGTIVDSGDDYKNLNNKLYRDIAGVGISGDDIITENVGGEIPTPGENIVAKLSIIRLNGGEENKYFSRRDGTGQIGLLKVDEKSEFKIKITSINVNDSKNGIITNFPYL